MKTLYIILSLLLVLCLAPSPISAALPSKKQNQDWLAYLWDKEIDFDWTDAQYQPRNADQSIDSWEPIPALGKINEVIFCLKSRKAKGYFDLPKKQYLETLSKAEHIPICGLRVKYEIDKEGLLKIVIMDTIEDMEGLFYFKFNFNLSQGEQGDVEGEIWVGDSYRGKLKGLKYNLMPRKNKKSRLKNNSVTKGRQY